MDSMVRATRAKGKSQFRMASIGASDGRHDKRGGQSAVDEMSADQGDRESDRAREALPKATAAQPDFTKGTAERPCGITEPATAARRRGVRPPLPACSAGSATPPAWAGVSGSALQAARLVLEAVDPLRSFARIQRLLDVAIAVVRLRALERFRQPLDKALNEVPGVAHLPLRRRMEGPATLEWCATVAHNVQIGISGSTL
jgi:hypothetical protein